MVFSSRTAALLGLLAIPSWVAYGFVPMTPASKAAIRRGLPATEPPLDEYEFRKNTEVVTPDDSAASSSATVTSDFLPICSVEDDVSAGDPSNQILRDSISRTRPQDVLGSILAEGDDTAEQSAKAVDGGDASAFLTSLGVSNLTTTAMQSSGVVAGSDDVKAVLALTEAAAIEAEATLQPELLQELELATVGTNASSTASFVSSEESLPIALFPEPAVVESEMPEILKAAQVVGEPATKIESPDVRKILKFAIPAIGVWLCGPLLSLIDTSAVGVLSGTLNQAALNPAVAVTDYAALLIAFMYTGTTNMVAAAQESDRATIDKPRTAKTMIGAMQMSTFVGAGLGAVLFAFARPLLKAIIGNDGISPAVFAAAMKYVRIRALGMPAAAVIGSTQAACLGMQDIRSPLYVLAAAAVVNFFGDVLFVGNSHPLIGGAAGAAWATVISQYVAVAFFLRWLCNKPEKSINPPKVLNVSSKIMEMTSTQNGRKRNLRDALETLKLTNRRRKFQDRMEKFAAERRGRKLGSAMSKLFGPKTDAPAKDDEFSVRGFLKNRFSPTDLLKVPDKESRREFAPYVIPVTTTQVGRVSGYVAMSHVVASSLGTVSMAAQQVIVSLFYCLCPIADSLSLTAQSFVPSISEKEPSLEKANAMKKVFMSFMKAGAFFGAAMMAAVGAIPLLSGFFTSDPAVISLVNSVVPLLLVFFATHGFVCGTEGLLLGQKDLGFLGKMYAAFFAAVPFLMLRVKRAALSGSKSVGLTSVWNVFIGYQVFRCAAWLVRSAILQKRTDAEAKLSQDLTSP